MTHADDWFAGQETGILGHGHDSMVIDQVKHTRAAHSADGTAKRSVALVAQATLWALETRADEWFARGPEHDAMVAFLHACAVPKELYQDHS